MDFRSQPDARPDQRLGAAPDEAASLKPPSQKRAQRPAAVRRPLTTATIIVIALALGTVAVAGLTYVQIQRQRRISESTASATSQNAPIGVYTEIFALSMDSPTDGWALERSSDSDFTNAGAWYLLHISHGVVTRQATLPVVVPYPFHQLPILQALSPTDVWALVNGPPRYLLHYTGSAWITATIMTPEGLARLGVDGFTMRTPTDGWAIGPSETTTGDAFYHYDGATWTPEPASAAATSSYVPITGMSVAPGGDVWATGYTPEADDTGRLSATGYVFHRASGVWQVTEMPNVELYGITMTGAKSGWIIGAIALPTLPPVYLPLPILMLTFDGAGWTKSSAPLPPPRAGVKLRDVVASGPSDVWILGPSNVYTTSDNFAIADPAEDYLIHFDGSGWSNVALPAVAAVAPSQPASTSEVSFSLLASAGPEDLWIVSARRDGVLLQASHRTPLLYHYVNNQWATLPLPTT